MTANNIRQRKIDERVKSIAAVVDPEVYRLPRHTDLSGAYLIIGYTVMRCINVPN